MKKKTKKQSQVGTKVKFIELELVQDNELIRDIGEHPENYDIIDFGEENVTFPKSKS